MDTSEPIHFEGPWTEAEARLIEAAVADAEGGELPSVSEGDQVPWMATCHKQSNPTLYAVSRIRISRVLSAESAGRLAEKIRALNLSRTRKRAVKKTSQLRR